MLLSLMLCAFVDTPSVTELQRIVANDPQNGSLFGSSLDVCCETIVVGAAGDDTASFSAGAVYVFERTGTTFFQTHKIIPSDLGNSDCFGSGVAIDANRFVAGAPDAHSPLRHGSVYVFERIGTTWTEHAQIIAMDAQIGSRFGGTVDLSGDTIVVGAPGYDGQDGAFQASGAVYVFERLGTIWTQQAKLTPLDDNDGNGFGAAVSLNGEVLAVGATGPNLGQNVPGTAYVFRRNGSSWLQEAQVFSGFLAHDGFGPRLQILGDRLVVGSPEENVSASDDGAVYVFSRIGTTWPLERRLLSPTSRACGLFGWAVGLMENGSVVASATGENFHDEGWGHVFDFNGLQWQHRTRLLTNNPLQPNANLGRSTASSGDLVLLGTPVENVGGTSEAGAIYVYNVQSLEPTSYCAAKTTSQFCLPFISSAGLARLSPGFGPFLIESHDHVEGQAGMLLYSFKKASLSFHGGTLCVKVPFRRMSSLIKHTDGVLCLGCGGSCRSFERNFNQLIQSGQDPMLTAGQRVNAQWRQRDPADPLGFGDNLSEGLSFLIGP